MRLPKQFSIRALLVTSVVVGVLLATWIGRSKKQQAVVRAVCQHGGWVVYSEPFGPFGASFINYVGYDYFCSIDWITLYPTELEDADEQIKLLKDLPSLNGLAILPYARTREVTQVSTPPGYAHVGFETGPSPYGVNEPDFPGGLSVEGLDYLLKNHPELESLCLMSARIPKSSQSLKRAKSRIPNLQCKTHTAFLTTHKLDQ